MESVPGQVIGYSQGSFKRFKALYEKGGEYFENFEKMLMALEGKGCAIPEEQLRVLESTKAEEEAGGEDWIFI